VSSNFQPCPSVGEAFALDFWDDLTSGYDYYGFGSYDPSGEGSSRPPGADDVEE